MPFREIEHMTEQYRQHAMAALSEGMCPDCSAPVTAEPCRLVLGRPVPRQLDLLVCVPCDTEWWPAWAVFGDLAFDDPRYHAWFRSRLTRSIIADARATARAREEGPATS